jgi:hypothetical protein
MTVFLLWCGFSTYFIWRLWNSKYEDDREFHQRIFGSKEFSDRYGYLTEPVEFHRKHGVRAMNFR